MSEVKKPREWTVYRHELDDDCYIGANESRMEIINVREVSESGDAAVERIISALRKFNYVMYEYSDCDLNSAPIGDAYHVVNQALQDYDLARSGKGEAT